MQKARVDRALKSTGFCCGQQWCLPEALKSSFDVYVCCTQAKRLELKDARECCQRPAQQLAVIHYAIQGGTIAIQGSCAYST